MADEYLGVGRFEVVQTWKDDDTSLENYVEEEDAGSMPSSTFYSNKLIELGLYVRSEVQKKDYELQNQRVILMKDSMRDPGFLIQDVEMKPDLNNLHLLADSAIKAELAEVGKQGLPNWNKLNSDARPETVTDKNRNSTHQRISQDAFEFPSDLKELAESLPCLRRLLTSGNVTISKVGEYSQMNISGRNSLTITKISTDDNSSEPSSSSPSSRLDWSNYPAAQKLLKLLKTVEVTDRSLPASPSLSTISAASTMPEVPVMFSEGSPSPVLQVPHICPKTLPHPISVVPRRGRRPSSNKKTEHVLKFAPTRLFTSQPITSTAPTAPTSFAPQEVNSVKVKRKRTKAPKPRVISSRGSRSVKKARADEEEEMDPTIFLEVSLLEDEETTSSSGGERQRKYRCHYCPKAFYWSTDLKRHTMTHTGERPFSCPYCPNASSRKFLIEKHIQKYHPELDNEYFTRYPTDCRGGLRPPGASSILKRKCDSPAPINSFLHLPPKKRFNFTFTDDSNDSDQFEGRYSNVKTFKEEMLNIELTSPIISPERKYDSDSESHRTPQRSIIRKDWNNSPGLEQLFEVKVEESDNLNDDMETRTQPNQRLEKKYPLLAKQLAESNCVVSVQ